MEKYIHIRIVKLLDEKGISKTRICKDLDLQRGNFNKYCRDDFHRIDANLLIKLCEYFNCGISELLEIREKSEKDETHELNGTVKVQELPPGYLRPVRRKDFIEK